MPTPPAELWVQYSLIGILVLTTALIALAFYKLWRELIGWIEKQDAKRDAERATQRNWESEQAKQRDQQWQTFLKSMQEQWLQNDRRNSEILERLASRIDDLTISVNNHDTWVRASGSGDRPTRSRKA
jgi:hypothetical protein